MTHDEYKRASEYWKIKDADSVLLKREDILKAAIDYIKANDTCALATGTGDYVRCTPIEYTYHDDAFWMFTEGGEKFIGLEHNKNVSLAIFDKYTGFGKLKGMQVTGTARIIEPFSDEYNQAAQIRKIPLEALRKMPHPMNLIKISPNKIEFLNSEFRNQGGGSRQMVEMD